MRHRFIGYGRIVQGARNYWWILSTYNAQILMVHGRHIKTRTTVYKKINIITRSPQYQLLFSEEYFLSYILLVLEGGPTFLNILREIYTKQLWHPWTNEYEKKTDSLEHIIEITAYNTCCWEKRTQNTIMMHITFW
jgi:UDP-2,3-diacylglucosamine pyrophosphatase LpxH